MMRATNFPDSAAVKCCAEAAGAVGAPAVWAASANCLHARGWGPGGSQTLGRLLSRSSRRAVLTPEGIEEGLAVNCCSQMLLVRTLLACSPTSARIEEDQSIGEQRAAEVQRLKQRKADLAMEKATLLATLRDGTFVPAGADEAAAGE